MKTIPLTQGFVALVDDADYNALSQFKWYAQKANRNVYAARMVRNSAGKRAKLYMHVALIPGAEHVNHEDGNGLNNQRYNVHGCTHQQNLNAFAHKKLGVSSAFRGVSWNTGRQKWMAQIQRNGVSKYLGLFTSELKASQAYLAAKEKI